MFDIFFFFVFCFQLMNLLDWWLYMFRVSIISSPLLYYLNTRPGKNRTPLIASRTGSLLMVRKHYISSWSHLSINKGNSKKKKHFFFRNFSRKCKLYFVWNWFIIKIILISQKIFVLRLFKMVVNQIVLPEICHQIFGDWKYKVCEVCMKNHVLVKKMG